MLSDDDDYDDDDDDDDFDDDDDTCRSFPQIVPVNEGIIQWRGREGCGFGGGLGCPGTRGGARGGR